MKLRTLISYTLYMKSFFLVLLLSLPTTTSAQFQSFVQCDGTGIRRGSDTPRIPCDFCYIVSMAKAIVDFLIVATILITIIVIVVAGIRLVISRGNEQAMEAAKQYLTNAVVGLILVLASWLVIDTVMKILVNQNVSSGGASLGVWHEITCGSQPVPVEGRYTIDLQTDTGGLDPVYVEPAPEVPAQPAGQICYPGCGSQVCFQAVTLESTGYNYAGAAPSRFIDVDDPQNNTSQQIICGYTLNDFNRSGTCGRGGRYVYVDPSAVTRFQSAASRLGNPRVNSSFRSPPCNSQVGGARQSQHMQGKAFDIASTNDTATVNACRAAGATFTQTYSGSNFVHCDWR